MVVLGGSLRDSYTLDCGFGSSAALVLARCAADNQLECMALVHAWGRVSLPLSMNGQQHHGASAMYLDSMRMSYVSPSIVLAESGTALMVHGYGLSSASESMGLLTCRLGSVARCAAWAGQLERAVVQLVHVTRRAAQRVLWRGEQQCARVHRQAARSFDPLPSARPLVTATA